MSDPTPVKDLFVLSADREMANVLAGLLARPMDLGIRRVEFDIERHLNRDSGCRTGAVEYLRPFLRSYRHALVVFDRDGCGSNLRREEIQQRLGNNLGRNGWQDRARVVVIDPELEVWIWANSTVVSRALGWDSYRELRHWLASRGLWPQGSVKPNDPKKAMEQAMRSRRAQISPRLFRKLADKMDFSGCRDLAFNELRATLRTWFPPEGRE